MIRIQIITILVDFAFMAYIAHLIVKGRLREEYAIVWGLCTFVLVFFSFWREGLNVMSKLFGVSDPPNLVFTSCIFAILIYLLHLSVVASKLHKQNKQMAQEIAHMKEKISKLVENK